MGLKYASGDSAALMSALAENLSIAKTMLDSTDSACDQLVGALGDGQLSRQGYASAKSMFTEAIKPGVSKVNGVINDTQSDLNAYTQADGLVSQYGDLDEDRLRAQLVSVQAQRDLTKQQIDANRTLAASSATLPAMAMAMAMSLEMTNARLETVQFGLEDDIRELEGSLFGASQISRPGTPEGWIVKVSSNVGSAQDAASGFAEIGRGVGGHQVSFRSSNVSSVQHGANVANQLLNNISELFAGVKEQAAKVTSLAIEIEARDNQDAESWVGRP